MRHLGPIKLQGSLWIWIQEPTHHLDMMAFILSLSKVESVNHLTSLLAPTLYGKDDLPPSLPMPQVATRSGSRADIPVFGVLGDDIDPGNIYSSR